MVAISTLQTKYDDLWCQLKDFSPFSLPQAYTSLCFSLIYERDNEDDGHLDFIASSQLMVSLLTHLELIPGVVNGTDPNEKSIEPNRSISKRSIDYAGLISFVGAYFLQVSLEIRVDYSYISSVLMSSHC